MRPNKAFTGLPDRGICGIAGAERITSKSSRFSSWPLVSELS